MKFVISRVTLFVLLFTILVSSACHKAKVVSTPPPPPPPPAAPTASLAANPPAIEKGQSATLSWETANATTVRIDAVGDRVESKGVVEGVQPTGSLQVTPLESTTYTLYAQGPGGKESATARITVTVPPPPPVAPGPSDDELFLRNVKDIYFDFDQWQIRPDQLTMVQTDAAFLNQHPDITVTVEGHCDERGSVEYNLALGVKRATVLREALVEAGVSRENVATISYGKEKPACTEHDESCWQENRRDHFTHER